MNDGFADDQLLSAMREWSRAHAQEEAAGRRSQRQWQQQVASEEMRFHGALLDAFEAGLSLELLVRGSRRLNGRLSALGRDVCALTRSDGRTVFVAVHAIVGLVLEGSPRSVGTPSARSLDEAETSLADVLLLATEQRVRVRILMGGADTAIVGDMHAVGDDMVTLALDGEPRSTAMVPLAEITEMHVLT